MSRRVSIGYQEFEDIIDEGDFEPLGQKPPPPP